jgi:ABC-type Na+ transport system ATPase subunit NatA
MLDAKCLSKWFGAIRAVSDVSFSLAGGEVLGYLSTMPVCSFAEWLNMS